MGLGNNPPGDPPPVPFLDQGVMADVPASPNDPIFINHHTMIDCIFELWLKCNSDKSYPSDIPNELLYEGHRKNDYIVPFIPLYTHQDMFKTADEFGYTCDLDFDFDFDYCNDSGSGGFDDGIHGGTVVGVVIGVIMGVAGLVGIAIAIVIAIVKHFLCPD